MLGSLALMEQRRPWGGGSFLLATNKMGYNLQRLCPSWGPAGGLLLKNKYSMLPFGLRWVVVLYDTSHCRLCVYTVDCQNTIIAYCNFPQCNL